MENNSIRLRGNPPLAPAGHSFQVGKMRRKTIPFPQLPPPALARVRQAFSSEHVSDVRNETRQKLLDAGLRMKIKPGARITITAGSRGIGGFVELLAGIAD